MVHFKINCFFRIQSFTKIIWTIFFVSWVRDIFWLSKRMLFHFSTHEKVKWHRIKYTIQIVYGFLFLGICPSLKMVYHFQDSLQFCTQKENSVCYELDLPRWWNGLRDDRDKKCFGSPSDVSMMPEMIITISSNLSKMVCHTLQLACIVSS